MSWWNTSNFTDLASKALKNAQKKIDSALDISEAGGKEKPDTTETSVQKETKGKSEFWGAWGGESSSEDNTGGVSAWSFPWGASTGEPANETKTESLIKVKSAEEIKSEVLKAAKERTKAKAKLFPQKGKTEKEKSLPESAEEKDVSATVRLKNIKPPDTGEIEVAKEKEPIIDKSVFKLVKETELVKDTLEDTKLIAETETARVTHDTQHGKNVIQSEVDNIEAGKKAHGNEGVTIDSKHENVNDDDHIRNDGLNEIDDSNVQNNEKEKSEIQSEIPAVDVELEADVIKKENKITVKSIEVPNTETTVTDGEEEETKEDISKGSVENIENVPPQIEEKDEDLVKELSDINLSVDLSSGDISSSVEFVSKTDIPVGDTEHSSSDPEIIDCDKINSDEEYVIEKVSSDLFSEERNVKHGESVIEEEALNKDDSKPDTFVHETSKEPNLFPIENIESKFQKEEEIHLSENDEFNEHESFPTDGVKPDDSVNVSGEESLLMIIPDNVISETVKSLRSSDSESSVNKLDSSMETCTSEETIVETSSTQDDSYDKLGVALKNQEDNEEQSENITQTEEIDAIQVPHVEKSAEMLDIQTDSEGNDTEKGTISPAHSFVKCMLEDAIEEGKHGDDNSDSHSSIEKSEGSRSVYSNQESGDEIDTTTSSDIEIISMPTPNGENRQVSPLDPIPLRIALQKTSWRGSPTHRRTDSSDSSNASGGNMELSPGRECSDYAEYQKSHGEHIEGHSHAPELPALSEEDDNPYHPQRLLKDETNMEASHDIRSEGQMSPDPTQTSCDLDPMSHNPQTPEQVSCAGTNALV